MFRMLPSLQVLYSHNRRGELVFSDDEDSMAGEGGESELYEEDGNLKLDDDMMEELRMRGISVEDYMKSLAGAEGGEDDLEDDYNSEAGGDAFAHEPDNQKRQKTEWSICLSKRAFIFT